MYFEIVHLLLQPKLFEFNIFASVKHKNNYNERRFSAITLFMLNLFQQ